jgi:hypothetical protein
MGLGMTDVDACPPDSLMPLITLMPGLQDAVPSTLGREAACVAPANIHCGSTPVGVMHGG